MILKSKYFHNFDLYISVTTTTVSVAGSNVGKRYQQRYTMEDMASALEAVRNNVMKKSEAAKQYGIPLTTLLDKISGRSPMFTAYGARKAAIAHQKSGKKFRPKRSYTREAMLGALEAVRSGRMSKKEASLHFDVPYSTMADKLYGRTPE